MKLLTLNVHAWLEVDQMKKLDQLIDRLVEANYDVIAFQEINQAILDPTIQTTSYIEPKSDPLKIPVKKSNFANLIVERLRQKGLDYYWTWTASHVGYDIFDEGLAILSKEPLNASGYLLSNDYEYSDIGRRNALVADIEIADGLYTVVNVHLSWWETKGELYFQREWDELLKRIPNNRLIIMGDFNNEAEKPKTGYQYIQETAPFLNDSYNVADRVEGKNTMSGKIDGWANTTDGKRIDYIFVSNDLHIKQHKVVFDGINSPLVSDHFGIEVLI